MSLAVPRKSVAELLDREIKNFVTVDFETRYDADYSLSKLTTEAYVRDPRFEVIGVGVKVNAGPTTWMTADGFAGFLARIDWSEMAVLCHHAHFDAFILAHHFGLWPAFILDTLSMARALHGTEVGGSLAKLAAHYQVGEKGHEVILAKGKRRADFTPDEWLRYGEYCKNDVELTYALFQKMLAPSPAAPGGFPEEELHLIDVTCRMFTEPTFILDEPLLQAFLVTEKERKAALLSRIGEDRSVLMSNDKFAALLAEYGVEAPRKISPRTGKETWAFAKSDPGFQELLEHEDPEVVALAEARLGVKSTINESRTERFLNTSRRGGSIPVGLKYYGAHTGRWSGGGDKMNFQNLPRGGELRKSLLAPPGKLLVVADSGQIEARVTAWFAGHSELMDAFRRNDATKGDFYSDAGSIYFGKTLSKKETPVERQVAKSMLLGLQYGLGWRKFAGILLAGPLGAPPVQFTEADGEKYDVDVAYFAAKHGDDVDDLVLRITGRERLVHCAVTEHFVRTYRSMNAPIAQLWKRMEEALGDTLDSHPHDPEFGPCSKAFPTGCLKTVRHGILLPNGLTLRYPGLEYDDGFTYLGGPRGKTRMKAYGGSMTENVVQALARNIVAEQMLRVRGELGLHVVSMSHDEIVLVEDEGKADAALEAAVEIMRIPPAWAVGLPLNAEGGVGRSYGAAK